MSRVNGWNRIGLLAALLLLVACVGQPQTAGQPAATVPSAAASSELSPTARPDSPEATDAPKAGAEPESQSAAASQPVDDGTPLVYFTADISAAGLVKIYAAPDRASLIRRIERQHGIHTLEHAEEIGLGSRTYTLINIDS